MVRDEPDAQVLPTPLAPDAAPYRTSATPKPRWKSRLDWVTFVVTIAGLFIGVVLPWIAPDTWSLDLRHNVSDIGVLLFLVGTALRALSFLLTDWQKGFATTRDLFGSWGMRLLLLGLVISLPPIVWLTVADLVGPPLRLSFPTSLSPVADDAKFVALCFSLLGVAEVLWRSWRGRRGRRAVGVEPR
jgi:hypothetical protein